MADMPTDFWSGWIIVLTVVGLIGFTWFIFSVYFSSDNRNDPESPVWDESLTEGANPAPMWWFWMILCSLVFSVGYLMLYPGLGSYSGMLQWSQGGRLEDSMQGYRQEFADNRQWIMEASMTEIQADKSALDSAQRVFDQHCSACHGPDGNGQASEFPNLNDADWQWGGDPEQIEQTIRAGRQAVMPGWQDVIGDDGVNHLTRYMLSLTEGTSTNSTGEPSAGRNKEPSAGRNKEPSAGRNKEPGETLFRQYCAACHGPEGKGMTLLGAPDLTDVVSLYGATESEVRQSIDTGRFGVMPAFEQRLDDVQIRLLVAWLTR